jgi:hypothetical protein
VTLFSAPNYCGEFDNAGAMMSVDDTLLCSFQVSAVIPQDMNAKGSSPHVLDSETRGEASTQVRHRRKVRRQKVNVPPPAASAFLFPCCYDPYTHHVIHDFADGIRCTDPLAETRSHVARLRLLLLPESLWYER